MFCAELDHAPVLQTQNSPEGWASTVPRTYTNIENGHKCPSLGTALRVARILNEPVEQLFADDVSGEEPVRERARVRRDRC